MMQKKSSSNLLNSQMQLQQQRLEEE